MLTSDHRAPIFSCYRMPSAPILQRNDYGRRPVYINHMYMYVCMPVDSTEYLHYRHISCLRVALGYVLAYDALHMSYLFLPSEVCSPCFQFIDPRLSSSDLICRPRNHVFKHFGPSFTLSLLYYPRWISKYASLLVIKLITVLVQFPISHSSFLSILPIPPINLPTQLCTACQCLLLENARPTTA